MAEPGSSGPDFAIVGAPKTGTTALFNWLAQHPEIYLPEEKELHFFDQNRERGLDWYREQFAPAGDRLAGEATTTYLGHPTAVEELAAINPRIRLIALVRDPVDRAWSNYNYAVSRSWESDPFDAVVARELADLRAGRERPAGLIHESRYAHHLERAARHVPPGQILVLRHEDVESRPAEVFTLVCRFLDVDPSFRPPNLGERANETHHVRYPRLFRVLLRARVDRAAGERGRDLISRVFAERGYEPLDPRTRAELEQFFADDQARLKRFVAAV